MHDSGRGPDGALTVEVERDSEVVMIRPVGELDLSTIQTLDAELQRALNGGDVEVHLDLGGLTFIDSSGMQLLLLATARAHANGEQLRMLRGSSRPLQQAIKLSGLDHSLPFID
jgi:anti-sigma B factor antagonist